MRVKSYFAATVEEAMTLASQQMGEDAMLVYSRETTPETRYLGRYEVIFAHPEDASAPQEPKPPEHKPEATRAVQTPAASAPDTLRESSPAWNQVSAQLIELRGEIARLGQGLSRWRAGAADLPPFLGELAEAGVDPVRIAELKRAHDQGETALRQALAGAVCVDTRLGRASGAPRVVVLTGPHGAGKTSTLVKLAVHYARRCRRLPLLIGLDTERLGASQDLARYAELLGAGYAHADTRERLVEFVEGYAEKDLILIDTPGYSVSDERGVERLRKLLQELRDVDVFLTLSAMIKPADQRRAVERFQCLSPARMVFTHLDGTTGYGGIWAEAARKRMALSVVSTGPRIPDDLREVTPSLITRLILDPDRAIARVGERLSGRETGVTAQPLALGTTAGAGVGGGRAPRPSNSDAGPSLIDPRQGDAGE